MCPLSRPPSNFNIFFTFQRNSSSTNQSTTDNESRSKRGALELYSMVKCATGCDPLIFKGYGCYCGFLGSGRTLDGIDRWAIKCKEKIFLNLLNISICFMCLVDAVKCTTIATKRPTVPCLSNILCHTCGSVTEDDHCAVNIFKKIFLRKLFQELEKMFENIFRLELPQILGVHTSRAKNTCQNKFTLTSFTIKTRLLFGCFFSLCNFHWTPKFINDVTEGRGELA